MFRVSYREMTRKSRYYLVKIFVDCPQEVVRRVPQVWAWEATFSEELVQEMNTQTICKLDTSMEKIWVCHL